MNSQFKEPDSNYNITEFYVAPQGFLKWNQTKGDGVCIVKSYTQDITKKEEGLILSFLNQRSDEAEEDFALINDNLQVRLMDKKDLAKNKNIIVEKGWTYTGYVYNKSEGPIFIIYTPKEIRLNRIGSARLTLNLEFSFSFEKVYTQKKKWFSSKLEDTGYYNVDVSHNEDLLEFAENIYYEIKGYKIPLTKEVLKEGRFYIKTTSAPIFKSLTSSITIKEIK